MTDSIWIQTSFHPAFKCGGWAYVRRQGAEATGQAGGARYTTPQRMALTALVAALKGLPPGPVAIQIAAGRPPQGEAAPTDDLDLWAQLTAALAGRKPAFAIAQPSKAAPTGFSAAWAELARDKANAQGAFASAIPRPNLAKVPGLLL